MKRLKLSASEKRTHTLSQIARELGTKSLQLCSQSHDLRVKSKKLIEKSKPSSALPKKTRLTHLHKSQLPAGPTAGTHTASTLAEPISD